MFQIWILSNKEGAIMGLLNKLKNVLFEEEEIEIPETEVKVNVEKVQPIKVKEQPKKKEAVKMTFDADEDDILSDRELFKAEPTFNFPIFDEQEFDNIKKAEQVVPPTYENFEREKPEVKTRAKASTMVSEPKPKSRTVSNNISIDYHSPRENRKPREVREVRENSTRDTNRKFKPSPVISPVYGVLDKNYKKEDIVVRNEEKKVIDVDSVRKKAFGTLEEDIEKTLNTPVKEFYKEKEPKMEKELDELLKSASEEVIPVQMNDTKVEDYSFNIEEEPIESVVSRENELEILDRPKKKSMEDKLADETLENDLFDLIDSMYESREDGES